MNFTSTDHATFRRHNYINARTANSYFIESVLYLSVTFSISIGYFYVFIKLPYNLDAFSYFKKQTTSVLEKAEK